TYASVDARIAPGPLPDNPDPWPYPVLSALTSIVLEDKGVGDEITITFETLEVVTPPACKDLARFQRDVLPVFDLRRCHECHGGGPDKLPGTKPAVQILNFGGTDADVCKRALQRIDFGRPSFSPLISYPLRHAFGHVTALPNADDINPAWYDWFEAERQ